MLQISYAQQVLQISLDFQSCPDGSTPDVSGNCPTSPPPADGGETVEVPPATETPPPAAPPATETPPPAAPPAGASQGSNNTGNMSAGWANSILAVHNSERAAVGVPPLVWSDTLAAGAQAWAEYLARTGEFRHGTAAEGRPYGIGENIAGFNPSKGPTAPGEGTSLWVAEKNDYHGGPVGNLSTPDGKVIGHYTQMVWRSTTEVGCGTAINILVCRYSPGGNWPDESPYTAAPR